MAKQVSKRKKVALKPQVGVLQTGAYDVVLLREVIQLAAKEAVNVLITVPRSAANLVPLLNPNALKYIEFECLADSRFDKQDTFVLEVGKRKYTWRS